MNDHHVSTLIVFVLCWCNCNVSSLDTGELIVTGILHNLISVLLQDIDEINLNFNQIKRLINSFNNENLLKAVNFALDSSERSKA